MPSQLCLLSMTCYQSPQAVLPICQCSFGLHTRMSVSVCIYRAVSTGHSDVM
ncbi:hypothetical protein BDR03DRAFT_940019 [Suillus americanus]|nr:hypothetical protein BDR03DRAFT_940019 [Suillus americanus]